MSLNNDRAIKTPRWTTNEILHSDDINFIHASTYMNYSDLISSLVQLTDKDVVVKGLELTWSTSMTCKLTSGLAVSFSGKYFTDTTWGFVAGSGDNFIVVVPVDQNIAFDAGGSNDRIDVLEVRPTQEVYNSETRKFKDPVTGLVTSSVINTRMEYGYEFQVLKGTEASSPVAPTSTTGWIKLAEVYVSGSATELSQSDIKGVQDSISWTTDDQSVVLHSDTLDMTIANEKHPGIDNTVIPKGIYEEYTNLVQDPTDLTTGNWGKYLVTTSTSGLTVRGLPLTKVICDGSSGPEVYQNDITVTASVKHTGYVIIRKGNTDDTTTFYLYFTGESNSAEINWITKTVSLSLGDKLKYNFIDETTVEIWFTTLGGSTDTTLDFRISPLMNPSAGDYIYVTACMLVDNTTTMFPFVNGTHLADVISVEQTIPDKFILDMIIDFKFDYQTSEYGTVFESHPDVAHSFVLNYDAIQDKFKLRYLSNGTASVMYSLQMDNGASYIKLNQRFRIVIFLNNTTGSTEGSRFLMIPLESGAISDIDTWDVAIVENIVAFENLYIGSNSEGIQSINSEFEYFRMYSWGGVESTITNSDDIDIYLQNQSMILEVISDAFVGRTIEAGTSTSLAIQKLADDIRTGVGIQDGAILDRHLDENVVTWLKLSDTLNLLSSQHSIKQMASDGAQGDKFGYTVAISGDYAVVGAPYKETSATYAGVAYIYHKVGNNLWGDEIRKESAYTNTFNYFGISVAIDGDYIAVGSKGETVDSVVGAGAVYIYHRTGTNTWDTGTRIVASDGAQDDHFSTVAISGDYVVVGASDKDSGSGNEGAVYIFHRTGTNTWDTGTKITASDAEGNDFFGKAVAISGDYVVVGAPNEDSGGADAGAIYVFHRTGTNTWDTGVKLMASDAEAGDNFGLSISISGDYILVGSNNEDSEGADAGAIYIFRRTGTNTWDTGTKITAPDAEAGAKFGRYVSISGDYAVVGATHSNSDISDAGAVYLFHRTTPTTWDNGTKMIASDPESSSEFGYSVSISGNAVIVGAWLKDNGADTDVGASYIYQIYGND